MQLFNHIVKPTLLLDENKTRKNIAQMVKKAKISRVELRPHFKTHQSAEIGGWFSEEGITKITVSSVDMAYYFAKNGWRDITIAFPVNIRQIPEINQLAGEIQLGLVIESLESLEFLSSSLDHAVQVWIKVDPGSNRTGVHWENVDHIFQIARQTQSNCKLILKGVLVHAGHTYHANSAEEVCHIHNESMNRLRMLSSKLAARGMAGMEISIGDTPSSSLCDDFAGTTEIRPGNFVFYDAQQLMIGSCTAEQISVAAACPVVASHPERNELVIYGGAVHLSKDSFVDNGITKFGLVAFPTPFGWGNPVESAYVARMSQEHGIIHIENGIEKIKIGDLLCVLPAHVCLAVTLMKNYLTLDGRLIHTMNS